MDSKSDLTPEERQSITMRLSDLVNRNVGEKKLYNLLRECVPEKAEELLKKMKKYREVWNTDSIFKMCLKVFHERLIPNFQFDLGFLG